MPAAVAMARPRWIAAAILGLAVATAAFVANWNVRSTEQDWAHVQNVLLGEGAIRRFAGEVQVLSIVSTDEHHQIVLELVDLANPILRPYGVSLHVTRWAPDGPFNMMGPNTLTIMFADSSEYQSFVARFDFREIPDDSFGVSVWVERIDDLDASVSLVFTDGPQEGQRHVAAHELGHALGLLGHASQQVDSLMKQGGVRPWLAPIDRKVVRFLYGYLEYDDGPAEVRAAFDAHWRGISDD